MLGCIQPMSSPMMKRMLGFCELAVCACACALVKSPASKKLEMASAPTATFRTPAPKSMMNLLTCEERCYLHSGRFAMGKHQPIRGCDLRHSAVRLSDKATLRNEKTIR